MAKFFVSLATLIVLVLPVTVTGENLTDIAVSAIPAVTKGAIDTGDTPWMLYKKLILMMGGGLLSN